MSTIEKALHWMLEHEGGYTNDPLDHGGATNFGVTQHSLEAFNKRYPECDLPSDPSDLTADEACVFYRKAGYWFYDVIEDQRVATKLFDLGVVMGPNTIIKLVQHGLNALGSGLSKDGRWGPRTEAAVNAMQPSTMLVLIADVAETRFREIAENDPTQQRFLKGWVRRAEDYPL